MFFEVARFRRSSGDRSQVAVETGTDGTDLMRLETLNEAVDHSTGAADPFFKIDLVRRLRDAFTDATLVEIAGGRTFVPLDEPELVANEIRAAHALTA